MDKLYNFLIGGVSTLSLNTGLQHIDTASTLPSTIIDSVEALISLLGGILSTVVVSWLKSKAKEKSKRNKRDKA